jgi:hypothetical protein
VVGTCRSKRGVEKHTEWLGNQMMRNHLRVKVIDGRIILNWLLKKQSLKV